MKNKNFIQKIKERNKYSTNKRPPFYDLAGKYLPRDSEGVVVDIGSGYGFFADYLNLRDKYKNIFLLDADSEVSKKVKNSLIYKAPDRLPFDDKSVDFVHCSHLVEHLNTEDFFVFLREMDRALAVNGVLVISAPLLDYRFYEGLAHVRPYGPEGIIHYMCKDSGDNNKETIAGADGGFVSDKYIVKELVYRHTRDINNSEWGSRYLVVGILMKIFRKIISLLGFYKYTRNGYTLILEKHNG